MGTMLWCLTVTIICTNRERKSNRNTRNLIVIAMCIGLGFMRLTCCCVYVHSLIIFIIVFVCGLLACCCRSDSLALPI